MVRSLTATMVEDQLHRLTWRRACRPPRPRPQPRRQGRFRRTGSCSGRSATTWSARRNAGHDDGQDGADNDGQDGGGRLTSRDTRPAHMALAGPATLPPAADEPVSLPGYFAARCVGLPPASVSPSSSRARESQRSMKTYTLKPARSSASGMSSTPTASSSAGSPPRSHAPARQAQADVRSPCRHQRPRGGHQRRQGHHEPGQDAHRCAYRHRAIQVESRPVLRRVPHASRRRRAPHDQHVAPWPSAVPRSPSQGTPVRPPARRPVPQAADDPLTETRNRSRWQPAAHADHRPPQGAVACFACEGTVRSRSTASDVYFDRRQRWSSQSRCVSPRSPRCTTSTRRSTAVVTGQSGAAHGDRPPLAEPTSTSASP